jgi:hypothetical protein
MTKINFPLWAIALSSTVFVYGVYNAAGKAGKTGAPGENTCIQCHSGNMLNDPSGSMEITHATMSNNEYTPGQMYDMSVVVSHPGSTLFGFSIVALDANGQSVGTWTSGSDNQSAVAMISGNQRQYLTHASGGINAIDAHTFSFQWTAPAQDVGPVTFYATGNGANEDGDNSGDFIFSASSTVQAVQPIGVEQHQDKVVQLAWNAAVDRVSVLASETHNVNWEVLDLNGRIVKTQCNQAFIDFGELARGFYLVRCRVNGEYSEIKVVN